MSKQLISNMREGDIVSTYLQVDDAQLFSFRNKQGKYALFNLSDISGSIKGICWDRGEEYYGTIGNDAIVRLMGKVELYNGQLQINIDKMTTELDADYDPADFLPVSGLDVDKLFAIIIDRIGRTKNKYLKQLLESFFMDEKFAETFKRSPAAKSIHHSYLGGLAEHTSNCLRIAETLCDIYPQLDADLLCAGVILHDIGKTVELSYDEKLNYTDEGRLLGHIVLGQTMVLDKIRQIPDFPESLRIEVLHLIISHHGENMTGSPKRPKMAEACALHFLENLDAQTKRFIQIIEDGQRNKKDTQWTFYDRLLERYLYRKPTDEEQ